tara:strand:- start:563 stop:697 length:135 start_codon:yes stop_codon:yes gene_type:complete
MQLNNDRIKVAQEELERLKTNKFINRDRIKHAITIINDLKKRHG